MSQVSSPLKFVGGKGYMAKHIVSLMPRHLCYVEPFFGGGSVLFARDPNDKSLWISEKSDRRGVSEVINDIHGALTNFWQVLQKKNLFEEFVRIIEVMPFSENEWRKANAFDSDWILEFPVEAAVAFFVRNRQSLAGRMKGFASISRNRTRSGRNEQVSAWMTAVDGLPAVHDRLKNVLILNRRAEEVIKKEDTEDTLFVLDPPYLHNTRASIDLYQHEMTDEQHFSLLTLLSNLKGKFILCGYNNEMYDAFAKKSGWGRIDIEQPNHSAGGSKKRIMTESLWKNY